VRPERATYYLLGTVVGAWLLLCGSVHAAVSLEMASAVERFGRQEISFQLEDKVANPYDPADISVMAEFRAPSGKKLRLPAFFYREFDAIRNTPGSRSGWKARFTPDEIGNYTVRIDVSLRQGPPREAGSGAFKSILSARKGFVVRQDSHFALTSGERFLVLGANRCWGDVRQTEVYLADLAALAQTGATTVRVWLAPWWIPLEGHGRQYNQAAGARLDAIVAEAERLGLKIILCIEQHGNLQAKGGEIGRWDEHPYNAANGGPCRTVREFFSKADARRLFENRLRYLVARYGYSTAIMAWELFNEVEYVGFAQWNFQDHQRLVAEWHLRMATVLRKLDPFNHLIATSSHIPLQLQLAEQQAIDFLQVHAYAQGDVADAINARLSNIPPAVKLPVVVAEFGLHDGMAGDSYVTRGTFAALLCGRGGGALPWLQDETDVAPHYEQLAAAARFFGDIVWRKQAFKQVKLQAHASLRKERKELPECKVLALRGRELIIIMVYRAAANTPGEAPTAAMRGTVRVPKARSGEYAVEVWNARAGKVVGRGRVATRNLPAGAVLDIEFPFLADEIAIKAMWLRAAPQ